MRVPNLYRPGFNQMPAVSAGREDVLAAIDETADVAALDGPRLRTPYAPRREATRTLSRCWDTTRGAGLTATTPSPPKTLAAAVPDADSDLGNGLYSARWNDARSREKDYLAALAGLLAAGGQPTGADVARQLGQPAQAVSYLRERLLKKGTVYAQGRALQLPAPAWPNGSSHNEADGASRDRRPLWPDPSHGWPSRRRAFGIAHSLR